MSPAVRSSVLVKPLAPESPWHLAWRRWRRHRLAVLCGIYLVGVLLACLIGPLMLKHSQIAQNLNYGSQPPSAAHWMGTDGLGRDLMVRTLAGGRVSLAVGILATLVSLLIGVSYGALSGYLGGRIDALMMRAVDILYALPFMVIVILLIVVLSDVIQSGQAQLIIVFLAIGAIEWLTMARVVRGQVLSLKRQDFVTAAVAMGVPARRIILRHLIPNVVGPVIVCATLNVPSVMLAEGVLSFLGLGIQPPYASWGVLIQEGAAAMEGQPWMLVYPALFFASTLFALNFVGDGLRDALDPRAGGER
jgi:oligopeptide transport system permease protein